MKSISSYKKVQENCFARNKTLWLFMSLLFIFISVITTSHANTIDTQRQDYLAAKKAFGLKQYKNGNSGVLGSLIGLGIFVLIIAITVADFYNIINM